MPCFWRSQREEQWELFYFFAFLVLLAISQLWRCSRSALLRSPFRSPFRSPAGMSVQSNVGSDVGSDLIRLPSDQQPSDHAAHPTQLEYQIDHAAHAAQTALRNAS